MNTKKVCIYVPNEGAAKRANSTPALRISRQVLRVGDNIEVVNHKQFADMLRMYPLVGIKVRGL